MTQWKLNKITRKKKAEIATGFIEKGNGDEENRIKNYLVPIQLIEVLSSEAQLKQGCIILRRVSVIK